jgi:hypothetical protein
MVHELKSTSRDRHGLICSLDTWLRSIVFNAIERTALNIVCCVHVTQPITDKCSLQG